MHTRTVARLILAGFWLFGCKPKDDPEGTLGQRGRVEFSYRGGCFFGCPLEQPLLTGSSQTIDVSKRGDVEGVTVRSSDEDIVELAIERECHCERDDFDGQLEIADDATCPVPWQKLCDNRVLVQSHAPGRPTLALYGPDGAPLDQVVIDVRNADRIELFLTRDDALGRKNASEQTVAEGAKLELEAELYARDGLELLAVDGVHWQSSAPDVAVVSAFLLGRGEAVDAGTSISVEALAEGTANIRVEVPGADAELALSVESEP